MADEYIHELTQLAAGDVNIAADKMAIEDDDASEDLKYIVVGDLKSVIIASPIVVEEVRAEDGDGLYLFEDSGTKGIHVQDDGDVLITDGNVYLAQSKGVYLSGDGDSNTGLSSDGSDNLSLVANNGAANLTISVADATFSADVHITDQLWVRGNATFDANVTIATDATIGADVYIGDQLFVRGNATVDGNVYVAGDINTIGYFGILNNSKYVGLFDYGIGGQVDGIALRLAGTSGGQIVVSNLSDTLSGSTIYTGVVLQDSGSGINIYAAREDSNSVIYQSYYHSDSGTGVLFQGLSGTTPETIFDVQTSGIMHIKQTVQLTATASAAVVANDGVDYWGLTVSGSFIDLNVSGTDIVHIDGNDFTVNDDGNDVDFRIESNSKTHIFFVDGGQDRIGMGTSNPSVFLDIVGDTDITGDLDVSGNITGTFIGSFVHVLDDHTDFITGATANGQVIYYDSGVGVFTNASKAVAGVAPSVGVNTIVTVGTIATGTWEGTAIADGYIPTTLTLETISGSPVVTNGIRIGTDDTNHLIDEASNGSGSALLYIGNESILASGDIGTTVQGQSGLLQGMVDDLTGASTGILVKTGVATFTERTITVGEGLDISNGNGVSGNPALSAELATTANKGVASFNTNDFSVTSGFVTIKDGGINHTGLAGLTTDNHHAQSHSLASHSSEAHSELSGVTADLHHAQTHNNTYHSTNYASTTHDFDSHPDMPSWSIPGDTGKVLTIYAGGLRWE